jgi:hypothetical protein
MAKTTKAKNQPHMLHKQVAETIFKVGAKHSYNVIVDTDCIFPNYNGIAQHLPFFISYRPARESEVSNVDIVLIKDEKIKLVCEIEESGYIPTKIFGKLFSTASAKICRLKNSTKHKYYELDDNSVFIQVISTTGLDELSLKEKQGQLIENEINNNLKTINSWIKKYRLIYGDVKDFVKQGRVGYDEIERIINAL